jgi:pyrimidine-nucleoside phosphorylase
VGKLAGRRTVALLTDMSQPLGRAVGNALEVTESIEILQNKLADSANDLREVTLALGVEMLLMAGAATDSAGALRLLEEKLADGSAYKMFSEMVAAQGGDLGKPMAKSRFVTPAGAAVSGIVLSIDSERIGWAAIALGAGRKVASDGVDHAVGFTQLRKIGEKVELGAPLCLVHHTAENVDSVISELRAAFVLSAEPPPPRGPIVIERLE